MWTASDFQQYSVAVHLFRTFIFTPPSENQKNFTKSISGPVFYIMSNSNQIQTQELKTSLLFNSTYYPTQGKPKTFLSGSLALLVHTGSTKSTQAAFTSSIALFLYKFSSVSIRDLLALVKIAGKTPNFAHPPLKAQLGKMLNRLWRGPWMNSSCSESAV